MLLFGGGTSGRNAQQQPRWYFFLDLDPRGALPSGWHAYEDSLQQSVERLYQDECQRNASPNLPSQWTPVPTTSATSGFGYMVDFGRMVQKNTTSGKERPIARTTDGSPPSAAGTVSMPLSFATTPLATHSVRTATQPTTKATVQRYSQGTNDIIDYTAPDSYNAGHVDDSVFEKDTGKIDDDDKCAICLDPMQSNDGKKQRIAALLGCKHQFHHVCICECLAKMSPKCPLCGTPAKNLSPQGHCPSGTMVVSLSANLRCDGFSDVGTWELSYAIPSGIQASYHPNPGVPFSGIPSRTGYIPDTAPGRALVARLQYAFGHGLMFTVGTSLTTHQPNVVTWASIHVKTNIRGGHSSFGYPDDDYFDRCNDELNGKGVPSVTDCQKWLGTL